MYSRADSDRKDPLSAISKFQSALPPIDHPFGQLYDSLKEEDTGYNTKVIEKVDDVDLEPSIEIQVDTKIVKGDSFI